MNKPLLIINAIAMSGALAATALAQDVYVNAGGTLSNPSLGSGALSRNGTIAPVGKEWSELAVEFGASNIVGGIAAHAVEGPQSYRVADDFVVPAGNGWWLSGMRFFVYEPESIAPGTPVTAVNVRVWNAAPGSTGASVVWGSENTNIAAATSQTRFLRIFSSNTAPAPIPPDSARPVWQAEVPTSLVLAPGTYWVDYQFILSPLACTAFTPAATVFGRRSVDGANALQFDADLGWTPIIDAGRPAGASDLALDLPFVLLGGENCPADTDQSGGVDGDDVIAFFAAWDSGQLSADFNGDGGVDGDDVIAFFAHWDSGC